MSSKSEEFAGNGKQLADLVADELERDGYGKIEAYQAALKAVTELVQAGGGVIETKYKTFEITVVKKE